MSNFTNGFTFVAIYQDLDVKEVKSSYRTTNSYNITFAQAEKQISRALTLAGIHFEIIMISKFR